MHGAILRRMARSTSRTHWWCLRLIGRLAPGVSERRPWRIAASVQVCGLCGAGRAEAGEKPPVLSLDDAKSFPGYDVPYGQPLHMLMAMVGLVLLIAMANVVMLLLARNASRQREFSLRQALGAGRGELLRQLLIESLILVTAGGALAWAFAEMATRLLGRWAEIESSLAPDRTVLLFTLGVLAFAALLFGLAPLRVALAGGAQLALKTSAATSNADAGKSRTGRIVVALQMAMCIVLLVGAGLLIRTLQNLENTPLGMQVDGLVIFGVNPTVSSLSQGQEFYRNLLDKLRALPSVESVTSWRKDLARGGQTTAPCRWTAGCRMSQTGHRIRCVRMWPGRGSLRRWACQCLPDETLPILTQQVRHMWASSTRSLQSVFCPARTLSATPLDPRTGNTP